MTTTNLQRLSDEEIRHIFQAIDEWPGSQEGFVKAFAHAVMLAPRRDFLTMRPMMLILIGKYDLGSYLQGFVAPAAPERRTA